jgi:hypothetical protein
VVVVVVAAVAVVVLAVAVAVVVIVVAVAVPAAVVMVTGGCSRRITNAAALTCVDEAVRFNTWTCRTLR